MWNATYPPPMTGVKLILVQPPEPFKEKHEDIEKFLRDCATYFKVFCHHFQNVPSLMIIFVTPT